MKNYEKAVAHCYSTWGESYYEEYYGKNAPYPPVHVGLLRGILNKYSARNLIDVGCGPASFLREIFDLPIKLYGFDLTPEMITEGKRIFKEQGIPENQLWMGSALNSDDYKKAPAGAPKSYDAAICGGVLPHIAEKDDELLIKNIANCVKPVGVICIEARNSLFSLFTMNRYSYEFIQNELIQGEKLKAKYPERTDALNAAYEEMKNQFCMDMPPIRKGKETEPGYDEVLSRTHNPLVLKDFFEKLGLINVTINFYHFHALPPMLSKFAKDLFIEESLKIENPTDWRGYFMASAYYITAIKP
jgi:2-polyprenyl-3-methyl-5-hydroxy-6-metoxy-1,4-benzoquinol methylase